MEKGSILQTTLVCVSYIQRSDAFSVCSVMVGTIAD